MSVLWLRVQGHTSARQREPFSIPAQDLQIAPAGRQQEAAPVPVVLSRSSACHLLLKYSRSTTNSASIETARQASQPMNVFPVSAATMTPTTSAGRKCAPAI